MCHANRDGDRERYISTTKIAEVLATIWQMQCKNVSKFCMLPKKIIEGIKECETNGTGC